MIWTILSIADHSFGHMSSETSGHTLPNGLSMNQSILITYFLASFQCFITSPGFRKCFSMHWMGKTTLWYRWAPTKENDLKVPEDWKDAKLHQKGKKGKWDGEIEMIWKDTKALNVSISRIGMFLFFPFWFKFICNFYFFFKEPFLFLKKNKLFYDKKIN